MGDCGFPPATHCFSCVTVLSACHPLSCDEISIEPALTETIFRHTRVAQIWREGIHPGRARHPAGDSLGHDESLGWLGEQTIMRIFFEAGCGSLTACEKLLFTILVLTGVLCQVLLQGLVQNGNVTSSRSPLLLDWNTSRVACSHVAGGCCSSSCS